MRRWWSAVLVVAMSVLLLTHGVARAGSVSWPTREFVVYVATAADGGSDANNGLTLRTPVVSIARVHDILMKWRPETDVEVRILPGTYISAPFPAWRFYVPGRTVSFLPYDYAFGENVAGIRERPVFRNAKCGRHYCEGAWLTARPPTDRADPMYGGGTSGLRFYYLRLEGYSGAAISIMGDSERDVEDTTVKPPLRVRGGKGLNGNTFVGLHIRRIGNRWSGGHYGWGGIVLTNSSDNRIVSNTFANIENTKPHEGYIHGIYITHFSSRNVVSGNTFRYVSGDPIKVRNQSNDNLITKNTFRRTGVLSYYRAEFCGKKCAIAHRQSQQCPSYGNRFTRNRLLGAYRGGRLPVWSVGSGSYPYSEKAACEPSKRWKLRTHGNAR